MGDNKISEAVARLERAWVAGMDEEYRDDLRAVLDHLQGEAVPYGFVLDWKHGESVFTRQAGAAAEYGDYKNCNVVPVYLHPQPAALNEVSGNSGELGGYALLHEVSEQLSAVGCGACTGSMAPMEDLHGRISEYLATTERHGAEDQVNDLMDLLDQLSKRLPSNLLDRVNKALAATGKQQGGEVQGHFTEQTLIRSITPDDYGYAYEYGDQTVMPLCRIVDLINSLASCQPVGANGVDVKDVLHKAVDLARGGSSAIAVVGWITNELIDQRDAGTGVA